MQFCDLFSPFLKENVTLQTFLFYQILMWPVTSESAVKVTQQKLYKIVCE